MKAFEYDREKVELLMPRRRFSRRETGERLRRRLAQKQPILAAGCGIGIVAKMAQRSDLDLLLSTSEERLKMAGHPSCLSYAAVGNANRLALDALKRTVRMARDLPVVCGVAPGDPYAEIEDLIEAAVSRGADGIINAPAAGGFGALLDRDVRGSILNTVADYRLTEVCNEKNIFNIAMCFEEESAEIHAGLGADMIIVHSGYTVGGINGSVGSAAKSLPEICESTRKMAETARRVNPDIFVLCHGGVLNTPENVQTCIREAKVDGFYGGSVFDRIPIEESIGDVVRRLKALRLKEME